MVLRCWCWFEVDPVPADDVALLVVDWHRGDLEPAIFSIGATKAKFCLPRVLRIH